MSHGYSYIQQIVLEHLYLCCPRNNRIEEMWSLSLLLFNCSAMSDSATTWTSTPGFLVLHHLPELSQIHVHWVGHAIRHLILCCPLLLLSSIFPNIRLFSNESVFLIRWPNYWRFSFSISTSNEYSGLISFRIDWFHLLAVRGILKRYFRRWWGFRRRSRWRSR